MLSHGNEPPSSTKPEGRGPSTKPAGSYPSMFPASIQGWSCDASLPPSGQQAGNATACTKGVESTMARSVLLSCDGRRPISGAILAGPWRADKGHPRRACRAASPTIGPRRVCERPRSWASSAPGAQLQRLWVGCRSMRRALGSLGNADASRSAVSNPRAWRPLSHAAAVSWSLAMPVSTEEGRCGHR